MVNLWVVYTDLISMYMDNKIKIIIYTHQERKKEKFRKKERKKERKGIIILIAYHKCSKVSNTSCLPKGPGQTAQTQIRLLLKKQSDQGLPCLLF